VWPRLDRAAARSSTSCWTHHRAVRAAGRGAAAVAGRLRPDAAPAGPAGAEHGRGGPARADVLRRLRPVGGHPAAVWDDVAWLRQLWGGPFLVKGITRIDDAKRAVDAGATAVSVSNHVGDLTPTPSSSRPGSPAPSAATAPSSTRHPTSRPPPANTVATARHEPRPARCRAGRGAVKARPAPRSAPACRGREQAQGAGAGQVGVLISHFRRGRKYALAVNTKSTRLDDARSSRRGRGS
jgi:FMN-dependent dehydrogenase